MAEIYVIGGVSSSGYLNTVEEYDPATNTWATRTSMPTARYGFGAATASNGRIYAIGGGNAESWWLSTVEEYDPTTDTWITRASMPTGRSELSAATTVNGMIYAMGGDINSEALGKSDLVEEYNPQSDTWAVRAVMPTARYVFGLATSNDGKIYAIGSSPLVEEYTPPIDEYLAHIINVHVTDGGLSLLQIPSEVKDSTSNSNILADMPSTIQDSNAGGSITVSGQGRIVNCTSGNTVRLGSGTVQNVTVANGGINIGSGEVFSNTLTGGDVNSGGIFAGGGTIIRGNNIEGAPTYGINSDGTISVLKNRVVGATTGIRSYGGLIQGNLVVNSADVGIEVVGNTTVISNTLTSNSGSAIRVNAGSNFQINGNNLEGNQGTYDIENLTTTDIPAQNNWWGTTDAFAISQRIYDYDDDYTLGQVIYQPVAIGPIQSAPAYVRSVTLNPASPVGIETVNFLAEFSRPMDVEVMPELSFQSVLQNTWSVYNTSNSGLPDNSVNAFATDVDGSQWIGTTGGIANFNGLVWTVYDTTNSGLPSDDVRAITSDTDGSLWFGTVGGGVANFDGTNWVLYNTTNSGLPSDFVFAIVNDPDGSHWIATSGGIANFDGTNWTVYNTSNSGLPNDYVYSIVTDPDGSHWFGTNNGGVAHFDGVNWTVYDSSNSGLPFGDVRTIARDADGSHWFGTYGGVAHFDGTNWTVYDDVNSGLPNNNVYAILSNADGSHWFGTYGYGVADFDGSTWTVYNTSNSGLPNDIVIAIASGLDGSHWFGTLSGGVGLLRNYPVYPVQNNPLWLDETHFQASYDITSLIPRGDYRINAAGATGIDAIEIAPNSAYTFTIDYAGGIGDTTPPLRPLVLACGADTLDTLSAQWFASDPDGEITLYKYAIGNTPGSGDVINWTTTGETSFLRNGLNLVEGQTYYVSVKARNSGGLWSEAGVSTGVMAGSGTCPSADFAADPVSGESPLTVSFTDSSTGDITAWLWDFGDGITDTQPSPMHVYEGTRVYTVTLLVSGPGGSDLEIKPGYITATPGQLTADFTAYPQNGNVPLTVTFTDTSTGNITDWLWDFGDGITNTEQNPVHVYESMSVYTVSLMVTGPDWSDQEVKTDYITVTPSHPIADFTGLPQNGNAPLTVTFTDTSTGNITAWLWDFGDGTTSTLQNPTHIYSESGIYTVGLLVSGPGGSDLETKTNYILVSPASTTESFYLPIIRR